MPRLPPCSCGDCPDCRRRTTVRSAYQAMTVEERRAFVARRDPEKVRAADRARYERDKPKRLAAMKAQRQANPGPAQRARAKWVAANPDKRRAQTTTSNALRDGRLVKGPCAHAGGDCGGRIEAHHEDYSKPLDVTWLCVIHHRAVTQRRAPR